MNKGALSSRRGSGQEATRVAFSHPHRESTATRAVCTYSRRNQREAARAGSSPRHSVDAAAAFEQILTRASAFSSHESSFGRPYRSKVQNGLDSLNVGKDWCRRSYGASYGPKRAQGERLARSYGRRYGYHESERRVRSYGSRRSTDTAVGGSTDTAVGGSTDTATFAGACTGMVVKGDILFSTAMIAVSFGSEGGTGRPLLSNCYRQVLGRYGWRACFSIHLIATLTSEICLQF